MDGIALDRTVLHSVILGETRFYFDVSSVDWAKSVGYRWELYRRCWWILAEVVVNPAAVPIGRRVI